MTKKVATEGEREGGGGVGRARVWLFVPVHEKEMGVKVTG